jgi:hypothetical protein
MRRHAEHHLARERSVLREDRCDEAALPTPCERNCIGTRRVRHQRADRPERLDVVDDTVPARFVAAQQHRRQECTAPGVGSDDVDVLGIAVNDSRCAGELADPCPDFVALVEARERTHRHGLVLRIADDHARETLYESIADRIDQCRGDERAPDRRAFLPGLDGHLAGDPP